MTEIEQLKGRVVMLREALQGLLDAEGVEDVAATERLLAVDTALSETTDVEAWLRERDEKTRAESCGCNCHVEGSGVERHTSCAVCREALEEEQHDIESRLVEKTRAAERSKLHAVPGYFASFSSPEALAAHDAGIRKAALEAACDAMTDLPVRDGSYFRCMEVVRKLTSEHPLAQSNGATMTDLRSNVASLRDEYLKTANLDGSPSGQYLRNRIELAFLAGWDAAEKLALSASPNKVQK